MSAAVAAAAAAAATPDVVHARYDTPFEGDSTWKPTLVFHFQPVAASLPIRPRNFVCVAWTLVQPSDCSICDEAASILWSDTVTSQPQNRIETTNWNEQTC